MISLMSSMNNEQNSQNSLLKNREDNNLQKWEDLTKQVVLQNAWLASSSSHELNIVREGTSALRVASYWYHFSIFAVDFLCLTLPLIQNHANRSYVAQTVNEELGNGIPDRVHSVLLLDAIAQTGLNKQEVIAFPTIDLDPVLETLRQKLLEAKNDYEIAGFFLGFELLAEHNISHVFECLQPYQCTREELLNTPYFQEHFQVEPEHIRRAITMGMKSCSDDHQIKAMMNTFNHGIAFWNDFWYLVHQDVLKPDATSESLRKYALIS